MTFKKDATILKETKFGEPKAEVSTIVGTGRPKSTDELKTTIELPMLDAQAKNNTLWKRYLCCIS